MSKFLDETGLARIRDWIKANFATKTAFTGASSSAAGDAGLVPAPSAGDNEKFLRGDGTWQTASGGSASDMTGATSTTDGARGLVPQPLMGDQAKYLQGDGEWDTPAARHGTATDAVVEGNTTNTASGAYAHAEGYSATASGTESHAEGYSATASGTASHAEGMRATAGGYASHAEGNVTAASGGYSHAEGIGTTASGSGSHAEGEGTTANHRSQHVFGEYNVLDGSSNASTARGNYVEIVGNGTSSASSNARTLDWSGNEVLAGSVTATSFIGSGASLTNLPNATTRYSATLTTGGWTEDTTNNWYSQTVTPTGFTYSSSIANLQADLDMSSATASTASALQEAWALIGRIYADASGVTAICYGDTPLTNVPFILCVTGG